LSYPLYISHLLVFAAAYALFENQMRFLGRSLGQTVVILISITLAAMLLRFVQTPIDRYRWQFAQASTETRAERRRKTRNKSK
jgi:peptidoglycan/LPS O-acetylase OafA/YrhL